MNRIFVLTLFLSALIFSCGDASTTDSSAEEAAVSEEVSSEAESLADATSSIKAICLWNQSGLRSAPGKGSDAKWVTAINFGEVVSLTGEEVTLEGEDRIYGEMQLKGGDKGWSNLYLFAVNADRAASFGDIDVYKRPELTTFTGEQFGPGEIFAVMNNSDQPGWLEVFGMEKKKKGWIQENSRYKTDEIDVSVAIMMTQALAEKTPKAQEEALQRILSSSTFSSSSLIGIVQSKMEEISSRAQLPANQLYIIASNLNVRAEASTESEVMFQVGEGVIGTIIERSPDVIEVNGNTDYWYLIDVDGQEGWVFGHHTSKSISE